MITFTLTDDVEIVDNGEEKPLGVYIVNGNMMFNVDFDDLKRIVKQIELLRESR
jgi:hypothetical protein